MVWGVVKVLVKVGQAQSLALAFRSCLVSLPQVQSLALAFRSCLVNLPSDLGCEWTDAAQQIGRALKSRQVMTSVTSQPWFSCTACSILPFSGSWCLSCPSWASCIAFSVLIFSPRKSDFLGQPRDIAISPGKAQVILQCPW